MTNELNISAHTAPAEGADGDATPSAVTTPDVLRTADEADTARPSTDAPSTDAPSTDAPACDEPASDEPAEPTLADPVVELDFDGHVYRMKLPDAATDYIQKKIATERQPYEREMLEDIAAYVAAGDLVVDVGANVGNHTIYLAAVVGCRVEAFEPNASLCAALHESAALNGLSGRVRVHCVGIGSAPARARFEKALPQNLGAQRLEVGNGDIEVATLDSFHFDGPVKVLKIDVEGMETEVLHGATALIGRDRPILYVECVGEREFRSVARWLDAQRYTWWETFNATPTHLFLPEERVDRDRRIARLQRSAVQEAYRSSQLGLSVRQKLTRAYDNEREHKKRLAALQVEFAKRSAEMASLQRDLARQQDAATKAEARHAAESADLLTRQEAARSELRGARHTLQQHATEVAGLRLELRAAAGALEAARADLARAQADAATLEKRLAASASELAASASELAIRTSALDASRVEGARMTRERDTARETVATRDERIAALNIELAELHPFPELHRQAAEERDALRAELEGRNADIRRLERSVHADIDRFEASARADAERLVQASGRIASLEQQLAGLREERHRMQRALDLKQGQLSGIDKRYQRIRQSTSYALGSALVGAARSLPGAVRLPATLWTVYRGATERKKGAGAPLEVLPPTSTPTAKEPAAPVDRADALPVTLPPPADTTQARAATHPVAPPVPRLECHLREVASLSELRVACVFDEFTFHSFAPECQLLELRPDTWSAQIDAFEPDLIFIESAWRGVDDTWAKKVSDASPEILALIEGALERRIPTAFWCKEDPVHFGRFLPIARLVDHVFTTDIDCIAKYKDALQHDRIHLLPFAAQPATHNPVEHVQRQDGFCFAGSYYPHYPERQADFRTLIDVSRKLGPVHIYDRNADRPQPHAFGFPDDYRHEIRGTLPYAEVDRAYKGYRYGITVNTIKQSQTMFARRAFELMACNTVVVSNFSKGLRLFFGDLVVASDNANELERRLREVEGDDALYRAHRLRALRKVLAEHTYEHRLAYVASKVAGRLVPPAELRVCMVGEPADASAERRLIAAFERQKLARVELVLVGGASADVPQTRGTVHRVADRTELSRLLESFDRVAPLHPLDHYGADYLFDLTAATKYSDADVITKAAHFVASANAGVTLDGAGLQYRGVETAAARRSLVRPSVLRALLADAGAACVVRPLADATLATEAVLAVDEFSYCQDAYAHTAGFEPGSVELAPTLYAGVEMATVLEAAEHVPVPERSAHGDAPIAYAAADWLKLFPKAIDARLTVTQVDDRFVLDSVLGGDEHQYIYLTRRFTPAELGAERESFFQVEAEARLDLRTVFVFHDRADKKISHVMNTVGARYALHVPQGTASIRLALRIQGHGQASLGRLTLAEPRGLPQQVLPADRHLLVTNQYPDYDDLYRYAFVHARVRAYARAGTHVEVLRLSQDPKILRREFQGINVVEADQSYLEQCLAGRAYESVLVHILDQRMWNVIRGHLDTVRVVVWVHGAEIQPWWRRAFNFQTDPLRDQARRTSDARMDMWREIIRLDHPNLRIVFISRKQVSEALADLRIPAAQARGIEVVGNYINTELFRYEIKDPALRHRILSIRPFASPVYGNDLSVAAIRLLAREPWFKDLHIRIVGDGALFDATVAPLRDHANVELTQTFLTQQQIAAVHRDYGVFLVPSRMDSQGVSRDEAMASGLVPVTTRIAAIPEFVDARSGFLAEPEDAEGLAEAIARLHHDPALFEAMSAAAGARVRAQSGHAQTIQRELELIHSGKGGAGPLALAPLVAAEAASVRMVIYGDLNLNIMDGSAIWAASLAETLGGIDGVTATLLLKARVHRTFVIDRLLDLAPRVQIVEPDVAPDNAVLAPSSAIGQLVGLDVQYRFRAFVLRGLDLCVEAAQSPTLAGRIWAYLTDIPQRADQMEAETRSRIAAVVAASEFLLCQTHQMESYLVSLFPEARDKTRILPPMIPPLRAPSDAPPPVAPFRLCYAGKFAPRWGIREMFGAFDALRARLGDAELHVFGDKIHNPADDPEFRATVGRQLAGTPGIVWHGAVTRDELMRQLPEMHVCWAFRNPLFERETLELSTKALEYAALGVPIIMARSAVNESVFGPDYVLFADSEAEATALLIRLAVEPAFRAAAHAVLWAAATRYNFDAVRADLVVQPGMFYTHGPAPDGIIQNSAPLPTLATTP